MSLLTPNHLLHTNSSLQFSFQKILGTRVQHPTPPDTGGTFLSHTASWFLLIPDPCFQSCYSHSFIPCPFINVTPFNKILFNFALKCQRNLSFCFVTPSWLFYKPYLYQSQSGFTQYKLNLIYPYPPLVSLPAPFYYSFNIRNPTLRIVRKSCRFLPTAQTKLGNCTTFPSL
jgi:hypothetical protein